MKNFNANYLESIVRLDCEPTAYTKIETKDNYDIYLTTHKGLLNESGLNLFDTSRYLFDFNGDGYIETARRWNPDATDPSFTVEFYNDTSQSFASQFIKQGASFGDLAIRTQSSGGMGLYLGGSGFTILDNTLDGLADWRIEYIDSTGIVNVFKDGLLVNTRTGVSIGATRTPSDPFVISDDDVGVMSNVKFWINTETTNDLVLDIPINDNSNTIIDYSATAENGTLTAGTGQWVKSDALCDGVISGLQTSSESITPEKGFSVLGGGSIELNEAQFTDVLRDLINDDKSIFNDKVEIYSGTQSLTIDDYEKVQTLYVKDITSTDVNYSINLQTAQIFSNKKLFEKQTTELFTGFTSNETLTEIEVLSTDGFELVAHDALWEDSPSEKVGYLQVIGQDSEGNEVREVLKYWSKDATKFYGDPSNGGRIERNVFRTGRVTATGTSQDEIATQVEEYIYIDLAAGKMILALLTGDLYGQVGETLPPKWNAGIDSSFVNITSLENIGFDLWNPADDTGFHFYIDNPSTETAKSYIARELLRVSSLAFLTDVNGEIAAKRFQQVIQDSGTVTYLDHNDITNKPSFARNSTDIRNEFLVRWDYRVNNDNYARNEIIIDLESKDRNGISSRAETILLKAVRNNSLEINELLKTVTDGIRTRLTNPAIKPSLQTNFRRTVELEVMDVIGLDLVGWSDYSDSGDINRPFEIQQIQHDWIKRTTSMKTYGSTDPASPIDITENSTEAVITDRTGWLKFEQHINGTFTDTGTLLTLTSNSLLGDTTADLNTTKKYYYDGLIDLNGFTLTIYGTKYIDADFDIRNSTIRGNNGSRGGSGQVTDDLSNVLGDDAYCGYDTSEEGASLDSFYSSVGRSSRIIKPSSLRREGGVTNVENLILSIDENGTLNGLPERFDGYSGSGGLRSLSPTTTINPDGSAGSDGGNGGSGLIILASDFLYNASSLIDLSASTLVNDTLSIEQTVNNQGTDYNDFHVGGGRGGIGWGGCLAVIIKDRSKPLMSNNDGVFTSRTSDIENWPLFPTYNALETSPRNVRKEDPETLIPFINYSVINNVANKDFAGNFFLSKYISGAVENIPQVGRDEIGLVPAPDSLTLTESIDTPSTPLGNLSTITANSVAPNDDNYSYTEFSFRRVGDDAYYPLTYKVPEEASCEVISNGESYEVKAQSVSKLGVRGGFITETITVKDVLTEPAVEPSVQLPSITGLQLKNRISPTELSKFKSGNAEFTWNAVSNNSAIGFGNEGALGASSGSFDPYFKDYQVNIYDESNFLIRTEYTKTESFTYTFDKNKVDHDGEASRKFSIEVLARGQNNQVGTGRLFEVENPQPEVVTSISAKPSYNSIQVDFVSPQDIDYIGVNMRFRKVGVTAWSAILFIAGTSCNVADLDNATEYEIELTSVDQFGSGASITIVSETTKIESASLDDITTPVVIDEDGGLLVTNNSGFTSVTGVSDGSWNQLPEPTIYTAINTSTDTQVYGVDVEGNVIIGEGDNSVTFINGLIGFGDNVTIGSNVDQTVTVGSGGDYATINEALEQLSKIVPAYKSGGFTATINILSGYIATEQIHIDGIDLSFITIDSVDAVVSVNPFSFNSILGETSFITVSSGARSPTLSAKFSMVSGSAVGIHVTGGGSFASFDGSINSGMVEFTKNVVLNSGASFYGSHSDFKDSSLIAIELKDSNAIIDDVDLSNSQTAIYSDNSIITLVRSKVNNTSLVIENYNSNINTQNIEAIGCDRILVSYGGSVSFGVSDFSQYTFTSIYLIQIITPTTLDIGGSNITNTDNAQTKIQLIAVDSSIEASGVDFGRGGLLDQQGSIIVTGGDISLSGARNYDASFGGGIIARTVNASNDTYNIGLNTLYSAGIVFK